MNLAKNSGERKKAKEEFEKSVSETCDILAEFKKRKASENKSFKDALDEIFSEAQDQSKKEFYVKKKNALLEKYGYAKIVRDAGRRFRENRKAYADFGDDFSIKEIKNASNLARRDAAILNEIRSSYLSTEKYFNDKEKLLGEARAEVGEVKGGDSNVGSDSSAFSKEGLIELAEAYGKFVGLDEKNGGFGKFKSSINRKKTTLDSKKLAEYIGTLEKTECDESEAVQAVEKLKKHFEAVSESFSKLIKVLEEESDDENKSTMAREALEENIGKNEEVVEKLSLSKDFVKSGNDENGRALAVKSVKELKWTQIGEKKGKAEEKPTKKVSQKYVKIKLLGYGQILEEAAADLDEAIADGDFDTVDRLVGVCEETEASIKKDAEECADEDLEEEFNDVLEKFKSLRDKAEEAKEGSEDSTSDGEEETESDREAEPLSLIEDADTIVDGGKEGKEIVKSWEDYFKNSEKEYKSLVSKFKSTKKEAPKLDDREALDEIEGIIEDAEDFYSSIEGKLKDFGVLCETVDERIEDEGKGQTCQAAKKLTKLNVSLSKKDLEKKVASLLVELDEFSRGFKTSGGTGKNSSSERDLELEAARVSEETSEDEEGLGLGRETSEDEEGMDLGEETSEDEEDFDSTDEEDTEDEEEDVLADKILGRRAFSSYQWSLLSDLENSVKIIKSEVMKTLEAEDGTDEKIRKIEAMLSIPTKNIEKLESIGGRIDYRVKEEYRRVLSDCEELKGYMTDRMDSLKKIKESEKRDRAEIKEDVKGEDPRGSGDEIKNGAETSSENLKNKNSVFRGKRKASVSKPPKRDYVKEINLKLDEMIENYEAISKNKSEYPYSEGIDRVIGECKSIGRTRNELENYFKEKKLELNEETRGKLETLTRIESNFKKEAKEALDRNVETVISNTGRLREKLFGVFNYGFTKDKARKAVEGKNRDDATDALCEVMGLGETGRGFLKKALDQWNLSPASVEILDDETYSS